MQATRIVAVRHGETAWNVDTRIQGHLDIPLNDTGLWQAERLARALVGEPIAAIYTSDLQRARATAQAVARATGAPLSTEPGLRERSFGCFQGRTFAQIEAERPEDARRWRRREPDYAPEGGESLAALRARITRITHALAQQHLGEQVLLVAHGGVLDTLYRLATGQEIQTPRTWQLSNAAINRLLWTPDGLTLVGWADTRHLDEADEAARDEPHS
ncbi:histidine phosphatase family protein [Verminephrobacter aporrectodeae subsp. tuberculatae]|uniref:histidine phosphatase family protein n=1 Tax=Verminephrobacter aporrectodeae TaxID=1110389 RepID=UPI0002375786|nr:histidine phosphatase family protein [Verminephrobacter aporrectodeae]MCW5258524.1 histidine phosphatase family protein [Verminephrobacter aporrectodeae subsp. tuberculatae]MCW8163964.1 histidine phosphatase family protein [Verminephrobacter aporrectodeae subsp. tuberculatae]MCW8168662.1 histidine phosphatase family protein [Verminephrobacter aporrectodeae subsp. tuberculatae]MCW8198150.1 histidine phosphatase family protein [Verminephrobacter aporrectodeae subsp. tuberculatae]MCW8206831.1 